MKKKPKKRGRPEKTKVQKVKISERFLVRGLVSNKGGTDCFGMW